MEYFRQYLLGRKFKVCTDHQAIRWIFSLKEPKSRIARWLEVMLSFDFEIEYRAGRQHGNADELSRCPNPRECTCPQIDNEEMLKCGPCVKCTKRAKDTVSSLYSEGQKSA